MFQDLTPQWETLAYDERNATRHGPTISFYGEKMTLNSIFRKDERVLNKKYVSIRYAANTRQIAIEFHDDKDRLSKKSIIYARKSLEKKLPAVAATDGKKRDGRGVRKAGRYKIASVFVKVGMMIASNDWIKQAVVRGPKQGIASYTPVYDAPSNSFIITLAPLLCERVPVAEYRQEVAGTNQLGTYAFYDQQDCLIYIGEGDLASRLRDHLATGLGDAIFYVAYFVTHNKQACVAFEQELLARYEEANHRLPAFNRQRGKKRLSGTLG